MHFTPGSNLGDDRAPCSPGSAWATRLAGLHDCLIQDSAQTHKIIVPAPVIRAPVEEEYPLWLAATVFPVIATATPPA